MTTNRSLVSFVLVALCCWASTAAGQCPCDCDEDGHVAVSEVVLGIGIVLGSHPLTACPNLSQCSGDSPCHPGIDSLVTCVQHSLHGCPTPSAVPENTPTPTTDPVATATLPPSTPTPTETCTPRACAPPTCAVGQVLHFPDACSCPFCATPTKTPTRTQTPTTTACRNVEPAAGPVTSPTEELTQDIFFCGIERGASSVFLEGAVTDERDRRSLSVEECPLRCPNAGQYCYAQPVQLEPNTTHHIRVVQNRGICGGTLSVDEDIFGQPLTIQQVSPP